MICEGGTDGDPSLISDLSLYCSYGSNCGNGIISNSDCALKLSDVTISGFYQGLTSYGDTDMHGCVFRGNGNDGWIPHGASHSGTITDSSFIGNGDWLVPNGIANRFQSTSTYLLNPDYGLAGSGVSSWGGSYILRNCDLSGNENCGLVTQFDSEIELVDCTITGNGHEDQNKANSGICVKANSNSVTLRSGTVSGNWSDGVRILGGTFHQLDGHIAGNGRYGVYQKGIYEIGRQAAVDRSNTIFLEKGHWIYLTEKIRHEDLIGVIETGEEDRKLARR